MIRRKPIRVANSKRAPARAVAVCLACEPSSIDPIFTTSYPRHPLAQTSETPFRARSPAPRQPTHSRQKPPEPDSNCIAGRVRRLNHFVQTALSKMTRRSTPAACPTLSRRVIHDKVIAFMGTYQVGAQKSLLSCPACFEIAALN